MASALTDFHAVQRPETLGARETLEVKIESFSRLDLEPLRDLNLALFGDKRLLYRYDHPDLTALMVTVDGIRAGFKIGYGKDGGIFYSAKGGVLPVYRRMGLARKLLNTMMLMAAEAGYHTFRYDTLAKKHKEMVLLGLTRGFDITSAEWMPEFDDFRLELSVSIPEHPADRR
jgi:GNAT superfamily N-acetyltransferase